MSEQPLALRLADYLSCYGEFIPDAYDAADELRRLHAENETLKEAYRLWMSVPQIQKLKAERDAAEAERDALLVERQWQPIRTAPKDGRAILVWNDTSKNCEVVFWNGHWAYQGEDHFGVCCSKWMSLDAAIDALKEKS